MREVPFQRIGSLSNTQVGFDFERSALSFFRRIGIELEQEFVVDVGVSSLKKPHSFDLGSSEPKILVECKSHRWTTGHNVPSAKMTTWNEAMYYFHAAPPDYRKIMFVLRDLRTGTGESLVAYYLRMYAHLVPPGVEFWEYDEEKQLAIRADI